MPQELLRDVVGHQDSTRASRRRWSVLPLSIAAHAALGLGLLIVPLAAVEIPSPAPLFRPIHVLAVAPVPTAPAGVPAGRRTSIPSPRSFSIPTVAPSGIAPERPGEIVPGAVPGPLVSEGVGVGVGLPSPSSDVVLPPPPPPPPARHALVKIGGTIRPPIKIVDVAPVYPFAAQLAHLEGVVVLEAIIDERGAVERVRVARSSPLFDEAAAAAVRRWRFTPTLLNGVPVPVVMNVTVNFTLRR